MLRAIKYFFLLLGFILFIACDAGNSSSEELNSRIYGEDGDYEIIEPWEESENNMTVLYAPSNMSKSSPTPIIFFAPGWKSIHHEDYKSLLTFIANHGYMAIYAKDDKGAYSAKHLIEYYKEMLKHSEVASYVDKSKIGVIGHSSGGGHAFKILKEFSDEGWGSKGRFLLTLEPWFSFDMNRTDMKTLPSNTNVLFIQFGKGGENLENNTDPRIPLSEYYLLSSINKSQKDYQIVEDANHTYPQGDRDYADMQGILKPLDALMEYTFNVQKDVKAYETALEIGSDDPYSDGNGIQRVQEIDKYHYRCDGNDNSGAIRTLKETDIDYCAMER